MTKAQLLNFLLPFEDTIEIVITTTDKPGNFNCRYTWDRPTDTPYISLEHYETD